MEKVELNILLNNINSNMKNYNKDINAKMKISDDLEMGRLKCAADKLADEISEQEQEFFPQSELLDLIEEGTEISTREGLEDIIPVNWNDDVLAGKYSDQSIVTASNEKTLEKKL